MKPIYIDVDLICHYVTALYQLSVQVPESEEILSETTNVFNLLASFTKGNQLDFVLYAPKATEAMEKSLAVFGAITAAPADPEQTVYKLLKGFSAVLQGILNKMQ